MILTIPPQPLWTFIALVVVCSMWVLGLLMVESAGHPEQDSITGFVYYKKGLKYLRHYKVPGLSSWNFGKQC